MFYSYFNKVFVTTFLHSIEEYFKYEENRKI